MTTSPMMKQWQAAKAVHQDGILFFRMGDFYEFFHDDAERAARLLGLTLTSRSKGEDSIPMAGVPAKSLDGYVRKLVQKGEHVVICEQVEDPREAKGIVQREVTRIVTPGTLTEDDSLSAEDHNYLAAAQDLGDIAGLAWVDISTGHFFVKSIPSARLLDELAALEPAECLLPESLLEDVAMAANIQQRLGCQPNVRPDFIFDRERARRDLSRHFGTRGLEGFGVDKDSKAIGPAGALFAYLEETQCGALGQIRRLKAVDSEGAMVLDRATRSSLELTQTLRGGERAGSLLSVLDRSVTAMGARKLKQWLLQPLLSVDAIERRQAAIAELASDVDLHDGVRRSLDHVYDLERLAGRVGCGRAHPRDLSALRVSLNALPAWAALLAGTGTSLLQEAYRDLPDLSPLTAELNRALVDEPPLTTTDGGIFRDEFNEQLAEYRRLSQEGKSFIAKFQAQETEATGISNLKVGYNRVFGYYLEVTNGQRHLVPERYERKQTLKNAERFVTAELKDFEDKVLHAEERAKKLEYDLFRELREAVNDRLDEIQATAEIIALVDVLQALAKAAHDAAWIRPEIHDGFGFEIEEGRHPVIEKQSRDEPFVPNDCSLEKDRRVMIITGPNMAGKSTYIRQVALTAILAQIGSFVPAKRARLGLCDRVFTRVGASDDLASGSSTFMVEMLEVANILHNATARSLVILDEVGRGTSTFDGLSLAWAITEHLATRLGAKTLFATHYHELCALGQRLDAVVNFNVAVREWGEEIVFLHRIIEGASDKSYGIHVARLAGIPPQILEESRRILAELEDRDDRRRLPVIEAPAAEQLDLFAPAPVDSLREKLSNLEINAMTPMEALKLLDEMSREARGGS